MKTTTKKTEQYIYKMETEMKKKHAIKNTHSIIKRLWTKVK